VKIEGIKYKSTKIENRANIASFAQQSDLVGVAEKRADPPWLELVGRCVRRISAVEIEQWTKQERAGDFTLGWDERDEDAEEY
jgi:hypothetical protein